MLQLPAALHDDKGSEWNRTRERERKADTMSRKEEKEGNLQNKYPNERKKAEKLQTKVK